VQTWILVDEASPTEAVRTGLDQAICGDCVHRAAPRSCYVNVGQAPQSIWRSQWNAAPDLDRKIRGMKVRLGAYGDPAAVPFEIWQALLFRASGWLGYTHQWATCDQRMKKYCMASVDSIEERDRAHDLGWRTFFVGAHIGWMPKDSRTTLCPASTEAGKQLTCEKCMSCSGLGLDNRVGDIFIPVHGTSWHKVNFTRKAA